MKNYFAIQWHITDNCDLRCKHCYIYARKNVKPVETPWDNIVSTFDGIVEHCRVLHREPYLYITGGDPMLHSRFWDFLELVHDLKIPFSIMGNPYHLNKEVCQMLSSLGCQKFQLSLDGLAPTHNKLRRPGSFKATVNAILPQKSDPYGIYDGCHCAQDHLTITAGGNIMACRRFDSVVGNVETGIYDAYKSSEMDKYRHYGKFEKCKDCVLLRFCRGCPAVAYGYKRDFYASDPQCWRTVKSSV